MDNLKKKEIKPGEPTFQSEMILLHYAVCNVATPHQIFLFPFTLRLVPCGYNHTRVTSLEDVYESCLWNHQR